MVIILSTFSQHKIVKDRFQNISNAEGIVNHKNVDDETAP